MRSINDIANLRSHYVYADQHVRAYVFVYTLSVVLVAALQLKFKDSGKYMTGVNPLDALRGVHHVEFSVDILYACVRRARVAVTTTTSSCENIGYLRVSHAKLLQLRGNASSTGSLSSTTGMNRSSI